jgi:hypothetical protein
MHNATFPAFLQDSKQTQKATQVNHLFKAQTNKHHHQITKLSHSINAIGPAPHRGGRKSQSQSTNKHTKTENDDDDDKDRKARYALHHAAVDNAMATQSRHKCAEKPHNL